jgi:hypothetical protein
VAAPAVVMAAVELGAGAIVSYAAQYFTRANMASAGRWLSRKIFSKDFALKSLLAKGGFNLFGQGASNAIKGELKLDGVGLVADMFLTPGASAVAGGIGSAGYDFETGSGYFEPNSPAGASAQTAIGLGFAKFGGGLQGFMNSNGVSKAFQNMAEGALKLYEETFKAAADKIENQQKK